MPAPSRKAVPFKAQPLRWHPQQKVTSGKGKDKVGGPGSQHGGQLICIAHGLEQPRGHPIHHSDGDRNHHTTQRATLAAGSCEGNCQNRHYQSDQGKGEFLLQLYFQAYGVKATLLQVSDVALQLFIIHFRRLLDFFLEVAWVLVQFIEGCHIKGSILLDGRTRQSAYPPLREDPLVQTPFPMRLGGIDAAGELEGVRVEFEDGYSPELVGVGIEDLVVEDVVVLSENPLAVSLQVRLRWFALDLVTQNFLFLVGVRDVELIKDKHGRGEDSANHNHRKGRAIDANPGGLHRRQLAGFLQQSKGDEHGQQHRDRRHHIQQRGAQVQQVLRQHDHRHFVADDVCQQLEEGEYQRQNQECRQHHHQVQGEIAQDHVVQDERELCAEAFSVGRCIAEQKRVVEGVAPPHAKFLQLLPQRFPGRTQAAKLNRHPVHAP